MNLLFVIFGKILVENKNKACLVSLNSKSEPESGSVKAVGYVSEKFKPNWVGLQRLTICKNSF